ncbi:MAG: hypothetical protein JWP63_3955, partial [Candidatus Solibacter sp.]|nr:hypothetical protein [Candidatus Solibacter sp.]
MSKNYKPGGAPIPPPSAPIAVPPKERERIVQLLASHQSERALGLAKDLHKLCKTAESEALLLDAYGARLASLRERHLDREAAALMDLVRERFPGAGERLREWRESIDARRGDPSALVAPLNDASLPAEKQASISVRVRREVVDLRSLAECTALHPQHPLRIAAQALHQAFVAVTSGPVDDASLALPEVPRSSPLSPWKMIIRAIAAYYRSDDALCERCLAAVEADSAPAGLVPPLRSLIKRSGPITSEASALMNQVCGDFDALRNRLKSLDSALRSRKHAEILAGIRDAVAACRNAAPELVESLKQQISVQCLTTALRSDKVTSAMGGPSLKDARFWRLLARTHEEAKSGPAPVGEVCFAWEQFRKHAIREGWLPAKGPEVAALHLRMVEQLQRLEPEALPELRYGMIREIAVYRSYYQNQPPEIRELQPNPADLSFLDSNRLLEQACEADPCKENFERWLRHAAENSKDGGDWAAETWTARLPKDVAPVLHLMQSAEKRNALKKAFTLMERAEQIDGLNPEVRRARLRLLVSITLRHLREKKVRLAEQDLRQLEALPQAQQGDRPAYVAALRFVCASLQDASKDADAAFAEVVRVMGSEITAHWLVLEVAGRCAGKMTRKAPQPTVPLFVSWGRVCAVCEDMGTPTDVVDSMAGRLMTELSEPNISAEPRVLAALGDAAMRQNLSPLAYVIGRVGLAQGAEHHARFLFLRARAMPLWYKDRYNQCLAGAAALARQRHD